MRRLVLAIGLAYLGMLAPGLAALTEQQGEDRIVTTDADHVDFVKSCQAAPAMQRFSEQKQTQICECTFADMVRYVPASEMNALRHAINAPRSASQPGPEEIAPHFVEVSRMCSAITQEQK